MKLKEANRLENLGNPSNGAAEVISTEFPYVIHVVIQGTADIIFHRWNCEEVEAKSKAAKGSAGKKTDNIESYVWRNEEGEVCLPGEYVRQSVITAAKFKQDPRSPRKSAMDLYKAGVISLTNLSSFGVKDWDYLDRRRVTIQRNAITRIRPAMRASWLGEFDFQIQLPEYIPPLSFIEVLNNAGKLVGVGDFRPSFGRFVVKQYAIMD